MDPKQRLSTILRHISSCAAKHSKYVANTSSKQQNMFSLDGKVAVVTGAYGTLGTIWTKGLSAAGAKVGVLGRSKTKCDELVREIVRDGGEAVTLHCSEGVTHKEDLENAVQIVLEKWNKVDILVNAAGGNMKGATIGPSDSFFDAPVESLRFVMDLNFVGTFVPCQVFGKAIANTSGEGSIINISSISSFVPLTRVMGYSAAKAAVNNLTCWLAVEIQKKLCKNIRVNALAPGFFLAEQNRLLLTKEDGTLTERGKQIIDQTPMRRFGDPEELVGVLVFLASDASKFMTGQVVTVDGGFCAYAGV